MSVSNINQLQSESEAKVTGNHSETTISDFKHSAIY